MIVSDNANTTYAIFNYENVEWYASTNQGGNSETGTGGKAAKVIFVLNMYSLNRLFLIWSKCRLDLIEETVHYGTAINPFQKMLNSCKALPNIQMFKLRDDSYFELMSGFNQVAV